MPTLVIRNINLNKYEFKSFNRTKIFSIYKGEVDNSNMKSIVHPFIKNGDVRRVNIPRWRNEKLTDEFK